MARETARASLAIIVMCALASTALAQGSGTRSISATVGATSDFVFRGLSYTRGKPAGLASFDIEFPSQTYFGGFVSSADPNPGPSPAVEMDFWLGHHWGLGTSFSADLRLTHYMYPDDPRVADYDRDELTATLGIKDSVFLAATYSPNTDAVGSVAGFSDGEVWRWSCPVAGPLAGAIRSVPGWAITASMTFTTRATPTGTSRSVAISGPCSCSSPLWERTATPSTFSAPAPPASGWL
jgi:hypothetical protein